MIARLGILLVVIAPLSIAHAQSGEALPDEPAPAAPAPEPAPPAEPPAVTTEEAPLHGPDHTLEQPPAGPDGPPRVAVVAASVGVAASAVVLVGVVHWLLWTATNVPWWLSVVWLALSLDAYKTGVPAGAAAVLNSVSVPALLLVPLTWPAVFFLGGAIAAGASTGAGLLAWLMQVGPGKRRAPLLPYLLAGVVPGVVGCLAAGIAQWCLLGLGTLVCSCSQGTGSAGKYIVATGSGILALGCLAPLCVLTLAELPVVPALALLGIFTGTGRAPGQGFTLDLVDTSRDDVED